MSNEQSNHRLHSNAEVGKQSNQRLLGRLEEWKAITSGVMPVGYFVITAYSLQDICQTKSLAMAQQIATEHNQHEALAEQSNGLLMRVKVLEEALQGTIDAMETSVKVGCTEHLDAGLDVGEFWYSPLDNAKQALEQPPLDK